MEKIDIVLPWVDSSDIVWKKEKMKYCTFIDNDDDAREIRFRDWNNLKYVFRGIEKHTPWVHKIHFITYGHLPTWLNTKNKKLNVVKHTDYIPSEFLPTFSSHVIELNMHRIKDLTEKFIYINDDIFFLKGLQQSDFFRKGLPCDINIPGLIVPILTNFSPIVFNSVGYINKHFNKRKFIRENLNKIINIKYGFWGNMRAIAFSPWSFYTGFYNHHLSVSYLKSTLEKVWIEEPEILRETCQHKFRNNSDVNQYIFRYWQLASGNFYPYSIKGKYFKVSTNNDDIINYIRRKKGKIVCINDNEFDGDFELIKKRINSSLEYIFPNKCSFEL